jgi:hypothetical protein
MSFAKKNWMPLLLFKGEKDKHNAYRLARWDTNKSSTKFQKKKGSKTLPLPACCPRRTHGWENPRSASPTANKIRSLVVAARPTRRKGRSRQKAQSEREMKKMVWSR